MAIVPVLVTTRDGKEFKLPESQVIVEYVQDLGGNIFASTDAQHRATARYIVERYTQLVQPHYYPATFQSKPEAVVALLDGLENFNALLESFDPEPRAGAFIQGQDRFAYADLSIAPFFARILSTSQDGLFPKTDRQTVQDAVQSDEKLKRLNEWWQAIKAVDTWNKVWDEAEFLATLKRNMAYMKK